MFHAGRIFNGKYPHNAQCQDEKCHHAHLVEIKFLEPACHDFRKQYNNYGINNVRYLNASLGKIGKGRFEYLQDSKNCKGINDNCPQDIFNIQGE